MASRKSIIDRFWSKVDKDGPVPEHVPEIGQCWIWTGGVDAHSYGSIAVGRTMIRAHRMSWNVHVGPVPDGLNVLHRCDNPPCVNPAHLWLGTQKDNARDRERKGRGNQVKGERHGLRLHPERVARGSRHHAAKIDETTVREIRRSRDSGDSLLTIAKRFGLHFGTVSKIVHRRLWKHVV